MSLKQHVNASGFPLQLALANSVRSGSIPGWNVLYEEHAWNLGEESGFIDLVLENQYKTWLMNIECKRTRDSEWIFLRPTRSTATRKHAKLWVSHRSPNQSFFDWADIPMDPGSTESQYCIVPGQDPKTRPMLERIAASVVQSTEALAKEELKILSDHYSQLRIYQNVIVTTALLKVCDVDPAKINLANGEIDDDSVFTDAPYVRFRKQLGANVSTVQPVADSHSLSKLTKARESTVFVVNSSRFAEFVDSCYLSDHLKQYIYQEASF